MRSSLMFRLTSHDIDLDKYLFSNFRTDQSVIHFSAHHRPQQKDWFEQITTLRPDIAKGPNRGTFPPTRSFAEELGVAPTVVTAYEQLVGGYIEGRQGAMRSGARDRENFARAGRLNSLHRRMRLIVSVRQSQCASARVHAKTCTGGASATRGSFASQSLQGFPALREAIAAHARVARGRRADLCHRRID